MSDRSVRPTEAQLAPVYGMLAGDFDGNGTLDLLLAGNFDGTPMGQPARDDIIISSVLSTGQFLGLLRGNGNGFTSIATYWNWIHDHEFHSLGYW